MTLDTEKDSELLLALIERASTAAYSQWNALLTFNGIVIAAVSILAVFGKANKPLGIGLILLAIVSSILLIWNFNSTVNSSQRLLRDAIGEQPPMEQFHRGLKEISRGGKRRVQRTAIAQILAATEVLGLLFIKYKL